jgi:DNA-binding transcriptional LysR family regulator
MRLAGLDLNLLVLFEALFRHRSVTRAARELGMSQSAASSALGRMRVALRDELFVRAPAGMEPTARALELAPDIARALTELSEALHGRGFDPATSTRTFRIGVADPLAAALIPEVVNRLAQQAPGVHLAIRSVHPGAVVGMLDDGVIELALAPLRDVPTRIGWAPLLATRAVLLHRADHPHIGPATLDAFCTLRHMRVELAGGTRSVIDARLAALGRTWTVGLTVNAFLAVPWIVQSTDLVCAVPERFAQALSPLTLTASELPPELQLPIRLRTLWSARRGTSAALQWLQDRMLPT